MSVIAQLPKDMGGAEGKVAYIGMLLSYPMSSADGFWLTLSA
jgi:hypothetical protein